MTVNGRPARPWILVAAVLVASACGSSTTSTATTSTQAAPAPTVRAAATSLGSVVVDARGRTLYRFDHDTAGAGTSACNNNCALTWPAATATGTPVGGPGVTATLAVIVRTDGGHQLTVDGHPAYRFSGDQAPGDTKGDGVGGIWHAILATPAPAGPGTSGPTATSGTTGGAGTATTAPGTTTTTVRGYTY